MEAFNRKSLEELGKMSVQDLLRHHTEVDDTYVKECRNYQAEIHDIITAKEKLAKAMKASPRELTQVFTPAASIIDQLKDLPASMIQQLRDYFSKDQEKQ